MKKPAAKKPSSVNAVITKMKAGVPPGSSKDNKKGDKKKKTEQEEEVPEDQDDQLRDKAKGQKFAKMRDSLPDYVLDLVEKESKKAVHPREFKTQVINRLFIKGSSGKLELNLQDQMFEEHKRIFSKKYSKEQDRAMPESIMCGLYFHNDRNAFKAALDCGDIEAVDNDDGKTYYAFKEYKRRKEEATVQSQQVQGSRTVTKTQAAILSKAFSSVGWNWNYKSRDCEKLTPGNSIPSSILSLIKEASDSQGKLAKEAALLIKNWPGSNSDERYIKLKKGHGIGGQNIAKLSHMREFHELPDDMEPTKENLDKLMLDMATHTNDYNELVEVSKGFIKAQKNWA